MAQLSVTDRHTVVLNRCSPVNTSLLLESAELDVLAGTAVDKHDIGLSDAIKSLV